MNCNKTYESNVRKILEYAVPIKVILGYLPPKGLLEKHSLSELNSIVKVVKQGNVKEFCSVLDQHQEYLINKGLYLVLDRLKLIGDNLDIHKQHTYLFFSVSKSFESSSQDTPRYITTHSTPLSAHLQSKQKTLLPTVHRKVLLPNECLCNYSWVSFFPC